MAKRPKSEAGTRDDVEDILGLFLMTFGQGVNPLHVHSSVVRAIRTHLYPKIANALTDPDWRTRWKADAASVLGWMAAVGSLSAQIAMEPKERRTVVNPSDFRTAMDLVMNEHTPKTEGKWCM